MVYSAVVVHVKVGVGGKRLAWLIRTGNSLVDAESVACRACRVWRRGREELEASCETSFVSHPGSGGRRAVEPKTRAPHVRRWTERARSDRC